MLLYFLSSVRLIIIKYETVLILFQSFIKICINETAQSFFVIWKKGAFICNLALKKYIQKQIVKQIFNTSAMINIV